MAIGIVVMGLAACSAAPPPNPTPTVAIVTPPVASSAKAPDPAPSASATEDADPDAPEPDCETQLAEAQSGDHGSVDDCEAILQKDAMVRSNCYPDQDGATFAILDAADCLEDVAGAGLVKLLQALPAKASDRQKTAHAGFRSQVQSYCTRSTCGISYGAHCVQGLSLCRISLIESAGSGTLELDAAAKTGKAIQGMKDFAAAVCQLPASAWKGGKVPGNCVNRALTWLSSCANPDPSCPDP